MINLQSVCDQLPVQMHVLIWIALLGWEYWLGKTGFGSSVGLFIETPITNIMKKLGLLK